MLWLELTTWDGNKCRKRLNLGLELNFQRNNWRDVCFWVLLQHVRAGENKHCWRTMTTGFIGNKIYSKRQQQNNNNTTLKEIFTKDRTLKQTEIRVFSMYSARFCKILTDCPHIWTRAMTVWTGRSTVGGNSYHEQLLKSHSSNNSEGGKKIKLRNEIQLISHLQISVSE